MLATFATGYRLLKGWKTIILSAALAGGGVLQSTDAATIVPPGDTGTAMVITGILVGVLRVLTDTPLGKK